MKPNYTIIPAREFCDRDTYAHTTSALLREAYELDPTVIPHTFEEMLERYEGSVLAVLENRIVGQASKYNSHIPGHTNDEEIGSVVVDSRYGNMHIGNSLVTQLTTLQRYYKNIISATVNPKMYPIFERNGFVQIDFPPEYLREGEQYLAPKMSGGIEEFHQKARCYMKRCIGSYITRSGCFPGFD